VRLIANRASAERNTNCNFEVEISFVTTNIGCFHAEDGLFTMDSQRYGTILVDDDQADDVWPRRFCLIMVASPSRSRMNQRIREWL